ncbi:MAG: aspartate aminotransferase family protein [Nitrososphaerales archaeon]
MNASIESRYKKDTSRSRKMYGDSRKIMPGGQSHNARFFEPYPFYAQRARGKFIWDLDGNRYTDYWMGHTALILGHSPPIVTRAIMSQATNGLLFGSPNKYAYALAELVTRFVPSAESVRFCTTGAEATMYAARLARAATRKKVIVKMSGGWHGYNSALTVGVSAPYDVPESQGLLHEEELFAKLANFNDIDQTSKVLNQHSNEIACIIVEPVMGASGVLPADREYLKFLKEECERIDSILIFDEIITGFRLALGGAQEYFGIKPDLSTLGKILGGGLPVSAIVGRKEILNLADTTTKPKLERCWIGGGTFSENALCMRAGIATLELLARQRYTVYSKISERGRVLRESVDKTFLEYDIRTKTTGIGSLFCTHFLSDNQDDIKTPVDVNRSMRSSEKEYYFTLIANHKIYFLPGHIGSISTVHTDHDIRNFLAATREYAASL